MSQWPDRANIFLRSAIYVTFGKQFEYQSRDDMLRISDGHDMATPELKTTYAYSNTPTHLYEHNLMPILRKRLPGPTSYHTLV